MDCSNGRVAPNKAVHPMIAATQKRTFRRRAGSTVVVKAVTGVAPAVKAEGPATAMGPTLPKRPVKHGAFDRTLRH